MNKLNDLPTNSRIWIYASLMDLSASQINDIENRVGLFLKEWNAHGKNLEGGFGILYNRFLVLAANESATQASGCSIDKSTGVFREIENQYQLGLLERGLVFFESNDEIKNIHFSQLEKVIEDGLMNDKTIVYDTTITTLQDLQDNFRTALENTWMKRYLKSKMS